MQLRRARGRTSRILSRRRALPIPRAGQSYANRDTQGMNDPRATQNKRLLLNLVRWLSAER